MAVENSRASLSVLQRIAVPASASACAKLWRTLGTRETASRSPDCAASQRRAIPIRISCPESRVQSGSLDAVSRPWTASLKSARPTIRFRARCDSLRVPQLSSCASACFVSFVAALSRRDASQNLSHRLAEPYARSAAPESASHQIVRQFPNLRLALASQD